MNLECAGEISEESLPPRSHAATTTVPGMAYTAKPGAVSFLVSFVYVRNRSAHTS
jgi:hypothetical protein